ncbi:WD40 repeat-like protein [Fomitiporia mediterranea MF3/22]|uniref:WD40 repeat-like protein n=1 Tax=Fomitiporia mediterranea (strain MF3/22) TaxID=694068 RepID=UPI0004407DDA|nr:WD40 repeat-like protein [Fomitiporia mediterranea MF3/22]EJD05339.1 WD40 repeat-like protein [Fomitiporia mediterranea MF3/22]
MRFTKPSWVMHQDGTRNENAKRLSMFSVHVHPDGSRIATGGLDAKIRIWSTKPILNAAADATNKPPKSLCTLTMHTGPVLTVRWAHSGRWLASGSDDEIIMIWDLDPTGSGKVWGLDEVNVEGWKPLKRLPGHESDVTDLAWSPEDRYLASTGLDSKVMIWCGYTLERLFKLDMHQGFVKGVCWDPVGEFLATQSDDRTVRIWRTTDWGLEATVTRPFEHSPGSTFFRRLSWSPDGAHITASNAMNNNGYVFTAAVISRNTWTSDISLVGHENTVEVACYNPHIFLRDPQKPVVTNNICSVVALGADDRSVSVWQTKSARPLIVAKEVFERQIMDLSWSVDGLALYAVSSDGTLAAFAFDRNELEGIAPPAAQRQYLSKFGFSLPPLPPSFAHAEHNIHMNGHTSGRSTPPLTPPAAHQNGFGHVSSTRPGEQVTTLVARRGPKGRDRAQRRIQPTFVGSLGGAGNVPSASTVPPTQISAPPSSISINTNANVPAMSYLPPPPISSSVSSTGFGYTNGFDGMDVEGGGPDFGGGVDMTVPISALDTRGGRRSRGDTITVSYGDDNGKQPKARTLGGDRLRDTSEREAREIRRSDALGLRNIGGPSTGSLVRETVLSTPGLKTFLSERVAETGDVLEARNSEDGKPTEITFFTSKEKTVQWLDYLPSPVLCVCASNRICAAAMEDGAVNVYSLTGRRIMPTLMLGSPVAFLDAAKYYLMAITASGQVYVWNAKLSSALHPPTSLLPFLSTSPPTTDYPNGLLPTVLSASIRPNGAPVVYLSTGTSLSYDSALLTWVRIGESWWASGSSAWKGRQRTSMSLTPGGAGNGIVASIEARVAEHMSNNGSPSDAEKPRPTWWTAAMTLGHLESRMHAARVLGSAPEYKQALLLYAKTIADEGFRGKAEEVLKELYGPVYW